VAPVGGWCWALAIANSVVSRDLLINLVRRSTAARIEGTGTRKMLQAGQ
jgi:hypothetical protein